LKTIPLKHGLEAIVDDSDFDRVNLLKWRVHIDHRKNRIKAVETGGINSLGHGTPFWKMQNYVLDLRGVEVDHIDRNPLNNSRLNLRTATHQQNCCNQSLQRTSSTGYKGVSSRGNGKFKARIMLKGVPYNLGDFCTKEEAAYAYNCAAKQLFGEFACLNDLTGKTIPTIIKSTRSWRAFQSLINESHN
jgi:HNH endonuclease